MQRIFSFVSYLSCFLFLACATTGKNTSGSNAGNAIPNLTREEAESRSQRLSDISYDLAIHVDLTPDYIGQETIHFTLKDNREDLRLDFHEGKIASALINGKKIELERTPNFLWLPHSALQIGKNTVSLNFTTHMQTDGTGLHRFVDPQDQNVFLYTQFEAFDTHKFMPCFDQPDLKAHFSLQVIAPKQWSLISTTQETSKKSLNSKEAQWIFAETPLISTYLFSLHAGPFTVWTDNFQNIPLRLFARPSLAKYVDAKFLFRITKQGLGFYNSYFSYPYPFKKYDQIIVPEFNAGAMENVAAVTFTEYMVRKGKLMREDRIMIAETILHEMAHMWFGDLVTMKWWDDLWLNESFATYMSNLAAANATEFKDIWRNFSQSSKVWAYYQDQLPTTHPIEANAKDVLEAFSNFDGITYGKGAAVLQQMQYWLTPEIFQKGVRYYIKTNAYQNAELKDFIGALQKFSDQDLMSWSEAWLKQAGVDNLSARVNCAGKERTLLTFETSPQIPGNFRPQKIELAFYQLKNGKLHLESTKEISLTDKLQNVELTVGCPDLVYTNYKDHAYIKVVLDEKSLNTIQNHIGDILDPHLRGMLWTNIWDMVRDQKMDLGQYAKMLSKNLAHESDIKIIESLVYTVVGGKHASTSILGYWPTSAEDLIKRDQFQLTMEKIFYGKLQKAASSSDAQIFWWDSYVQIAKSLESQDYFHKILQNPQAAPKGLAIDQDMRWGIVNHLCRTGSHYCEADLAQEKRKDSSDRGVRSALSSEAIQPNLGKKQKLYQDVLLSKTLSLQEKKSISNSLFPFEQKEMAEKFGSTYFDYLLTNKNSNEVELLSAITWRLSPLDCKAEQTQSMEKFLATNADLPSVVSRTLKELMDEDLRCQKVRARAASNPNLL